MFSNQCMLSKITWLVCAISSFCGEKTPDEMMPCKKATNARRKHKKMKERHANRQQFSAEKLYFVVFLRGLI